MSGLGTVFLLTEVVIVVFAWHRARKKRFHTFDLDINSADGQSATFNFWFFFLNSLMMLVLLENLFFAIPAIALWVLRSKIKSGGR